MSHRPRWRSFTRWVLGPTLLLALLAALTGAWAWRVLGLELVDWGSSASTTCPYSGPSPVAARCVSRPWIST